jgi:hypothetical protein
MNEAKFSGRRVVTCMNERGRSVIGIVLRRDDRIRQPSELKALSFRPHESYAPRLESARRASDRLRRNRDSQSRITAHLNAVFLLASSTYSAPYLLGRKRMAPLIEGEEK